MPKFTIKPEAYAEWVKILKWKYANKDERNDGKFVVKYLERFAEEVERKMKADNLKFDEAYKAVSQKLNTEMAPSGNQHSRAMGLLPRLWEYGNQAITACKKEYQGKL